MRLVSMMLRLSIMSYLKRLLAIAAANCMILWDEPLASQIPIGPHESIYEDILATLISVRFGYDWTYFLIFKSVLMGCLKQLITSRPAVEPIAAQTKRVELMSNVQRPRIESISSLPPIRADRGDWQSSPPALSNGCFFLLLPCQKVQPLDQRERGTIIE